MSLDLSLVAVLLAGGFCAGFINTLAGSGSAFSLAVLTMAGLPMDVANGTNRVAIVLQSLVATRSFHASRALDWARARSLLLPSLLGSLAGSTLATWLPREHLTRAIGVLMGVVLILLFVKPERWVQGSLEAPRAVGPLAWGVYFLIGLYGGFIQIGVGVLMLAGLVLMGGYDLVKANALKVLLVFVLTVPALLVFLASDLIVWRAGLIVAIGSMLGAWVAAREAARRGARFVRWLLIAVVLASTLRYLGVLDALPG